MHLVGFIIRIYHDARSPERQNRAVLTWDAGNCYILTLNPLTWKIWWALNNAGRWQMGFNSAFKGLTKFATCDHVMLEDGMGALCSMHGGNKALIRPSPKWDTCAKYFVRIDPWVIRFENFICLGTQLKVSVQCFRTIAGSVQNDGGLESGCDVKNN